MHSKRVRAGSQLTAVQRVGCCSAVDRYSSLNRLCPCLSAKPIPAFVTPAQLRMRHIALQSSLSATSMDLFIPARDQHVSIELTTGEWNLELRQVIRPTQSPPSFSSAGRRPESALWA